VATDTLSPEAAVLRRALTQVDPRRRRKDRTMKVLIWGAFVVAMIPLVSLIWSVISNGVGRFDLYFLTHSMRNVYGGMDAGGIYHALLGTLLITGLAALISVPIGILTAVYLVEYGSGHLARGVTFLVDVMTGIPSIVAGLFAFALFYLVVGPDARSGVVGAVALSVLMIPVVIRSTEEMLRLVPNELREASLALGVPKWLTIIRVVLRTSVAGITTGVGATDSINRNVFEGNMMTLPVYVYRQYAAGLVPCAPGDDACIPTINYDRAWSAALVLILVVMLLNLVARGVSRWFAPKTRA
jgi:phosphate transport system permease protein